MILNIQNVNSLKIRVFIIKKEISENEVEKNRSYNSLLKKKH